MMVVERLDLRQRHIWRREKHPMADHQSRYPRGAGCSRAVSLFRYATLVVFELGFYAVFKAQHLPTTPVDTGRDWSTRAIDIQQSVVDRYHSIDFNAPSLKSQWISSRWLSLSQSLASRQVVSLNSHQN